MKIQMNQAAILSLTTLCLSGVNSFSPSTPMTLTTTTTTTITTSTQIQMGLFDDLQLIFSDEGKKNRKAWEERERAEQEAAQREIFERRRNPEKMAEYESEVSRRRKSLQSERDVWKFQQKNSEEDPLEEWNTLRAEGKIQVGSDLERDKSSERLGSEGLIDVRIDERMPYIDQGYVDESADVMGNFMDIFGGKKKKENKKEE